MRGITSRSTDLFWKTPNIFLEDGITTLVTCHVVPSQTANAVVPSRCFVVLFVCKRLSNLNAAIWSLDLADDSPPEPAPPEVPPRGPSLHHPLQGHATMRGRSGGSIN